MNYLKRFNENQSEDGIINDIREMLLDVSDEGYKVEVSKVGSTIQIGIMKGSLYDTIVLDGDLEFALKRIMMFFELEKIRVLYVYSQHHGENSVWLWRDGRIVFIPRGYVSSPDLAQEQSEEILRRKGVLQMRVLIQLKDIN